MLAAHRELVQSAFASMIPGPFPLLLYRFSSQALVSYSRLCHKMKSQFHDSHTGAG